MDPDQDPNLEMSPANLDPNPNPDPDPALIQYNYFVLVQNLYFIHTLLKVFIYGSGSRSDTDPPQKDPDPPQNTVQTELIRTSAKRYSCIKEEKLHL
jgi:hypothetical protein